MRLGAHQCTPPTTCPLPHRAILTEFYSSDYAFSPPPCALLFPLLELHNALVIPRVLSLTSQSKTAALVRRFFTGRKDRLPTAGASDPLWSPRVPTSEATLAHALLSVGLTGWVDTTTTHGTPRHTPLDHSLDESHAPAPPASPSLTLGANPASCVSVFPGRPCATSAAVAPCVSVGQPSRRYRLQRAHAQT